MKINSLIQAVIVFFSLALCLASCKGANTNSSTFATVVDKTVLPDSFLLSVKALDLTEDLNALSSKNDEVLVLAYSIHDSLKRATLLHRESFVLTGQDNVRLVRWLYQKNLTGEYLSILLIERDTDQSESDIEQLVRNNYFKLVVLFRAKGNYGIETIIDDNDFIGIRTFDQLYKEREDKFEFKGIYKLDKYDYKLSLYIF